MKRYVPYIVIAILTIALLWSVFRPHKSNTTEAIYHVDTITRTIVHVDTIRDTLTRYLSERVIDTLYIDSMPTDGIKIPIMQRYYGTGDYEAWVSGYRPNLDSIHVFGKTVVQTQDHYITQYVKPKGTSWFLTAGSMFINKDPAPYVGVNAMFKNNIVVGASAGVYDRKPYWGINVGFKISSSHE